MTTTGTTATTATTGTFIGEFRAGSGGDAVITNPATEEDVAAFTSSGVADVDEAAAAARAAQPEWAAKTPGERSLALLRLADALEADAEHLAKLEVEDSGKPWTTAYDGELPFGIDNLRFFAGAARSLDGTGAGSRARASR